MRPTNPREIVLPVNLESGSSDESVDYNHAFPELEIDLKKLFNHLKDMGRPETYPRPAREKPLGVLGDFRIIKEIGSGGMATVYEAEQISLNRRVALKLLPTSLGFSSRNVLKFKREAEACGRQCHPGIVAIHAVGQQDGAHFIAQELVEGGYTLANRLDELREVRELPTGYFRDAAVLIADVAEALSHSHNAGVTHRDVKPSNILLTPEGQPKVTDFGLARVEGALALSRTGDFSGTPFYMSPEQAMCRRMGIDNRTDIYSLGVTLYEVITLKRPFEGDTSHEVLKKIVFQDPQDPQKVNPRIPRDLSVICLKAIEKDPNKRYQSMGAFAEDLDRFLQGEVIRARPSGLVRKLVKRVRRNPPLSIAIGVSLFLLVALILLLIATYPLLWFSRSTSNKQRDRALGELIRMVENDEIESRAEMKFRPPMRLRGAGEPGTSTDGHEGAPTPSPYERILDLYRGIYGEESPRTLEAMDRMAVSLAKKDLHQTAIDLFKISLEIRTRNQGVEDPMTLAVMNNLARELYEQGKDAEPGRLWEKATRIAMMNLERESLERTILHVNYGKFLRDQGLFKEMKRQFSECESSLTIHPGHEDLNTEDAVFHLIEPIPSSGSRKTGTPRKAD